MRKLKCPQCKISNLYIKNEFGERRLIFVMQDYSIVASKEEETVEGFNLDIIYCLGCSWSGSVKKLVLY